MTPVMRGGVAGPLLTLARGEGGSARPAEANGSYFELAVAVPFPAKSAAYWP
jgi:hypothetical protein